MLEYASEKVLKMRPQDEGDTGSNPVTLTLGKHTATLIKLQSFKLWD